VHLSTCLTLLGIEIDSIRQETRIEVSCLNDTLALLAAWEGQCHFTKCQLQALLGTLNFVCNVCRLGCTFMRRLVDLLSKARSPSHHIRLTRQSKQDIRWWATFLPQWNGKLLFYDDFWSTSLSCQLFTDGCKHSFGAFFNGAWFCSTLNACQVPVRLSIAFKELYAIMATLSAWDPSLCGKRLMFHCDNETIVMIIQKGSSKCSHIMALLRYMFFVCANNCIEISAVHIPGSQNCIADALSYFQLNRFHHLLPQADQQPTPIPIINWKRFK